jgi:predicted N-acetyltransferase YhbS
MATHSLPQERLRIRRATLEDAPECARICYEAFGEIADRHNFPRDFSTAEQTRAVMSRLFSHPGYYAIVAERDGRIIGSNCMDERSAIFGIGPITIDPDAQDRGAGRALMQEAMARAVERVTPGVRLVQAAYHNRSLALYAKLGFITREPLSLMGGRPLKAGMIGYAVHAAGSGDLEDCNRLCRRVHGHDRDGALKEAIEQGSASVVRRGGRITAYTTGIGFVGHAVAETNDDLQALIAAAQEFFGPGFLLPTRNAELLRWCLQRGMTIVQPMTLMTIGLYNEPQGAYLPSILY